MIDQTATIAALGPGLDGPVDGLGQLATKLVSQRRVADCAVGNFASMAMGRQLKGDNTCVLRAVKNIFAGSQSFADMFKALATRWRRCLPP